MTKQSNADAGKRVLRKAEELDVIIADHFGVALFDFVVGVVVLADLAGYPFAFVLGFDGVGRVAD